MVIFALTEQGLLDALSVAGDLGCRQPLEVAPHSRGRRASSPPTCRLSGESPGSGERSDSRNHPFEGARRGHSVGPLKRAALVRNVVPAGNSRSGREFHARPSARRKHGVTRYGAGLAPLGGGYRGSREQIARSQSGTWFALCAGEAPALGPGGLGGVMEQQRLFRKFLGTPAAAWPHRRCRPCRRATR